MDWIYFVAAYLCSVFYTVRLFPSSAWTFLIYRMAFFYVHRHLFYLLLAYGYFVGGAVVVVHLVGIESYAATILIQTVAVAAILRYQFYGSSQDAQKLLTLRTWIRAKLMIGAKDGNRI